MQETSTIFFDGDDKLVKASDEVIDITERYGHTVYGFVHDRFDNEEKSKKISQYILSHLPGFADKHKSEPDFQMAICGFCNEMCKQIEIEDQRRLVEANKAYEARWSYPAAKDPEPEEEEDAEEPPRKKQVAKGKHKKPSVITTFISALKDKMADLKERQAASKVERAAKAAERAKASPETSTQQMNNRSEGISTAKTDVAGFSAIQIFAMVICCLILLWMLCGLLMALEVLPMIDFGYTWFNQHIIPIF